MASKIPVLLAVCPGTRAFGVAIFRGFELVHFVVKTLKNGTSAKHLKKEVIAIWQEFFENYKPTIFAIKEINQYQRTSQTLCLIADCLKKQAEKNRVQLAEISLTEIRALLGNCKKPTNKKVFQKVVALYPELDQYANRPNKGQRNYYAYIFSAVAVGLVCLNELARKSSNRNS